MDQGQQVPRECLQWRWAPGWAPGGRINAGVHRDVLHLCLFGPENSTGGVGSAQLRSCHDWAAEQVLDTGCQSLAPLGRLRLQNGGLARGGSASDQE